MKTPASNQPPKYQQVGHALLREWAESGGRPNATQKELAEAHGVHLLTLRHALQWLEQTGQLPPRAEAKEPSRPAPLIGLPIWADSLLDLDVLRVSNRLRTAQAIHRELEAHGYRLDVQFIGTELNPNLARIRALSRQWAGVVLEPFSGHSSLAADHPFASLRERAVLVGAIQGEQHGCVCPDYFAAGQLAVSELVKQGARRILYTGNEAESSAHQFLRIASAENEAGRHSGVEILYAEGGFHMEDSFSAVKQFLARGQRCDAVLAASGNAAIGALRALGDIGIRCPEDVQIIAIGNTPFGPYLTPRFTTITPEPDRFGIEIARMAISLARPHAARRPNILVPVQLLAGETTRYTTASHTPTAPVAAAYPSSLVHP